MEHEEPDLVPLTDHIYMQRSLEGILGEKGVRTNTPEKYVNVHRVLGLDLICAFPGRLAESSEHCLGTSQVKKFKDAVTVDEWGIKQRPIEGMDWYVEGPIKTVEDAEEYEVPDPFPSWRVETVEAIVNLVKDDLAIAAIIGGPFTQGLLLFGFTNFMRTLHVAPSSVRRITEKVEGFQTELGKIAIDMGVDIVWIPDDLGMTDGPFLSPQAFRKYIFPSMKREVEAFKKRGVKVLLHSDGQIMALMDDIVEMGFDGIHPIERKAGMSLELMKAKYGDRLTLIGNVDATDLLPHGTAQQIRRQVLECLQAGAPGGGYILASDHSIHEGVKSANTKIMFEMARKYRKYPVRNRSRHTDSGDA